jgi:proton-coupled amino acid transporter
VLTSVVYIASCEIGTIADKGIAADVMLFNRDNFPLLIGTAVFAFEGIGLYVLFINPFKADISVIPITESMKEPQKFPRALTGVMITVALLFTSFGVLGYSAYGSDIQTVVLVNLPQEEKFVQASQFLCKSQIINLSLTPRFGCHLALHSSPTLPRRPYHGNRHFLA